MFDWLGQRTAVKGPETFDSVRGAEYLGMVYYTVPDGYLETTPSRYIERMASMMGVTHAKTPTTPGIRTRHPTEADEKPVDAARQRVFRAVVGKAQWILRARPDVLYAVKDLSRRLEGPREVDYVAAKRLVKYLYGTRDTALVLRPRKGYTAPVQRFGQRLGRLSHDEEMFLGSNGVVEWCTREFALQDTRDSSPSCHQKQSTTHA